MSPLPVGVPWPGGLGRNLGLGWDVRLGHEALSVGARLGPQEEEHTPMCMGSGGIGLGTRMFFFCACVFVCVCVRVCLCMCVCVCVCVCVWI